MSGFRFTPEAEADLLSSGSTLPTIKLSKAPTESWPVFSRSAANSARRPASATIVWTYLDDRHRFWSAWSYLIVYRWQVRPIQIVAVIHGARDLDAYFGGERPRG
jgi:hypothetical protein